MMYVVRSGRNWDNPSIEFVTDDIDLVKAALDASWEAAFQERLKWDEAQRQYRQERVDFFEFKKQRGDTLTDSEIEQYEQNKVNVPIVTWEEFKRERKSVDWFAEEVDFNPNVKDVIKRASDHLAHRIRPALIFDIP